MVNGTSTQKLHQLVMLDHTEQKLAAGRNLLSRWRSGQLGIEPTHKEDDMRIVSSGDVHVVSPQPMKPQDSGVGKVLAGAALGAALLGIPGAGALGYLWSQMQSKPEPQVITPTDDTTVGLGLRKFEELEGTNE